MNTKEQIASFIKHYREKYREDAPADVTLSITDKEFLTQNVPKLRHVPSSVKGDFLRDIHATKASDRAQSYLPKESRPFENRKPTRDNNRGRQGR